MIPGLEHYPTHQDALYSRMAMGVAWPAARDGFAVLVAEHRIERVNGKPALHVLDELTSSRLDDLVLRVRALNAYYHPEAIYADTQNTAAMHFVQAAPELYLQYALLCAMAGPMAYALPLLRVWMESRRLLVPTNSALKGELLTVPAHEDVATLKLGDYPGCSALAFAALGLDQGPLPHTSRQKYADLPERILP